MSSEQAPLLPSSNPPDEQPEQANQTQRTRLSTWRVRVAEALESAYVHKLVITLVRRFFPPSLYYTPSLTRRPADRHRRRMRPSRSRIYPSKR